MLELPPPGGLADLQGQRVRENRQPWSGTRALPQPRSGVHRAWSLVSGVAQSKHVGLRKAVRGAAWAATRQGLFDEAGLPSARGDNSAWAKVSASSTPPLRMSSTSCCCFSLKLSSGSPARIAGSTALVRSIACWISPHCTALRIAMRSDTVSRSMPAAQQWQRARPE